MLSSKLSWPFQGPLRPRQFVLSVKRILGERLAVDRQRGRSLLPRRVQLRLTTKSCYEGHALLQGNGNLVRVEGISPGARSDRSALGDIGAFRLGTSADGVRKLVPRARAQASSSGKVVKAVIVYFAPGVGTNMCVI